MKPIKGLTEAARAAGMKRGGYVPTGSIQWRVGQLHVSTSCLTIAREFWHKRAGKLARPLKRACVRAAIREHQKNQRMYAYVMAGMRG